MHLFLLLGFIVLILYFYKDELSGFVVFVEENWYYVMPFAGGWAFYRFFVLRMIRNGVILHVIGDRIEEYDISRSYLQACKVDGIQNMETAANGQGLLYCLSFDKETKTIRTGWNHQKETNIERVLTIKSNFELLTKENHQLACDYYNILDRKNKLAKDDSRSTVNDLMDFFARLSGLGINDKKSSEDTEKVDEVEEVANDDQ
jgi:hypothetical protein